MSLFHALAGLAHDQLRAKSPVGTAIGDAIGTALAERQLRKQTERSRTASLRHLKLDRLPPEQQRVRILQMAEDAGLLREDD